MSRGHAGGISVGRVTVDGRTLAYRRAGDGPPVLLLHSALSDSREWRRQLEALGHEFTVVAWDAPGCGGSFDPPSDFTAADFADQVAGLTRALDLGKVHLVGLSFGAVLALEVYRRHPAMVSSLVLASGYAGWAGSLPPEEVAQRARRALAEAQRPPREWVEGYLPGFFAGEVPRRLLDEVRAIMLDTRPASMRAMVHALAHADLRDVAPGIAVPTLLLHGEKDARAPRSVADDLQSRIPGSRLVVLPDVGHVCNLEAPAAFNAAVRTFLRSVAG